MAKIKMSSPWEIYHKEVEELFRYDEEVHVVFDEENYHLKIYVDNDDKATALSMVLPHEKDFGNVKVTITIYPANSKRCLTSATNEDVFFNALFGNKAFSFVHTVQGVFTNNLTYVVFKNKVVQYFNDNLSDIHGYCSTLYENIARDVFIEQEGVFFNTDLPEEIKKNVTINI